MADFGEKLCVHQSPSRPGSFPTDEIN